MAQSILDHNARYHIRLITGNNDNIFVCEDLVMRNFDEYIHYHLKKKGFEKIIFFDGAGNLGEYYLDEHSAELVRGKATKKKKRRRVSLLDDDEEELESHDDQTTVDRLKFPQITSSEFLTTYKTQISDPNHKTAVVFSNIVSFIHAPADAFQSYFDFIHYGFDENNENLTLFIAKEQAIESIEQLKNPTNDYFFNLIKSNLVHEVGSPDNNEIQLFLRRLKMIGLNNKYITFDEKNLDTMSEIIRMSMLDRISRNNVEEINRRYAGNDERSPHVALSYMSMGEIYDEFKIFLENSHNTVNDIDDTIIRQIFHYNDALEEKPYDVLMHTRGWESVAKVIKKEMDNFHNESKKEHYSIEEAKNRLENNSNSDGKQYCCPNYILIGNPGVGKTTVAKLIGRIFKDNGILKNGNVITVNSSALIGEYVGQTPSKTNRLIDSAKGGVLIIDEAYSLYANPHVRNDTNAGEFRQEAVDTLVSRALDNDICIILAGYSSVRKLYEMNEGFEKRFKEIVISSYEPDLLEHIFRNLCMKDHITLNNSIDLTRFVTNLKAFSPKRSFANAREIENIYHSVKQNMRDRDNTTFEITQDDFKEYDRYFMDVGNQQIVNKVKDKIDQKYVGLDNVKDFIQNLRYEVLREKEAQEKNIEISNTKRNILLVGNPGSGKTTVASLLAEFFYEMGVLATPDMISIKANSTSSTQLSIHIDDANDKGKLLFIDEANYYCNIGNAGKEMISPILNPSEDFKNYPDLRIVMAIYPENKDKFYQLDAGMERRFQEFTLNDYTYDELYEIFEILRKAHKTDISNEDNEYGYSVSDYIKGYFIYQSRIGEIPKKNASLAVELEKDISLNRLCRMKDHEDKEDMIKLQDFPQKYIPYINPILHNLNNPDYALQEVYSILNNYEGFENVKKHFEDIKTKIDINKEKQERGITSNTFINHHILFVGNPGTGKSTMLKLAAEFYTSLGVLSSNNPIYFDAKATANIESDGVSSFEKALKEANRTGRLLCIDEGNFFVETASGKLLMHDFVQAAQDKEHYPHLIVAMCIYPRNYKRFMDLDDGMERRFEIIELPNYTSDELYHMFEKIVEDDQLEIADEAKDAIMNIFEILVNVGAGEIRNASLPQTVFEELNIIRYRRSVHSEKQKYVLTLSDIHVFEDTKLNDLIKGDAS